MNGLSQLNEHSLGFESNSYIVLINKHLLPWGFVKFLTKEILK